MSECEQISVKVDLETYKRLKDLAAATARSIKQTIRVLAFTATAEQLAPGYATEEPDPNDDPDPGNADH
jgi:hypothetical protein